MYPTSFGFWLKPHMHKNANLKGSADLLGTLFDSIIA
jgi:hypothetical protein